MKSRNDQIDKIVEKIEAMHSYDQPAIAVMPIEKANKSFTNWVNSVIDVGIIIGKTRICDTPDAKLFRPIINAFPVVEILMIISVLNNKDTPTTIECSILLPRTAKLNMEETTEIGSPNNNQ
ncbi:uncharacterized protein TNCT_207211 [Trichonephila clavata]|uniref:Uncharacterized protein n=1 Tax=Trichonephila clavata TaxID=2740835 RepID=A0A8X6L9L7_TRICU|nr:uncharacterized protein TNCT_448551 [Trichonephila clavata]GFR08418.1 uncharacterized protein TNCT_207211 [Trichonephila clavata]